MISANECRERIKKAMKIVRKNVGKPPNAMRAHVGVIASLRNQSIPSTIDFLIKSPYATNMGSDWWEIRV